MKFFKAGEVPKLTNMYFIYGDGGTGKTSIAKQFPGHKLMFSFDKSSNAIIDDLSIDVMYLEFSDYPNIQQVFMSYLGNAIKSGKYETIILDNVTALQNLVIANIENASADGRQNWNQLQLWFRELSDYLKTSDLNIYATAHQVTTGAIGKGGFEADMNIKTFNAFTSMFDLVGRLYVDKGGRMIDLDPEQGNHAKNRVDDRTLIKAEELLPNTTNKTKAEEKEEK